MSENKKIVVQSAVAVKKSSNLRKVKRKAVAGLSEAELIERNSIGEFKQQKEEEEGKDASTDREDTV